jgi:hypothetical protein
MTATRRLAAIFAADVAGYSRVMGADEEGTLSVPRITRVFPTGSAQPLRHMTARSR